jgi:chromate transporter
MSENSSGLLGKPRPSLWQIFSTMLVLGIQSFGGGSATFLLIHRACIDRGWLDEDEFIRAWSLAQLSPGINLVKLTVLIGYHLRGVPGMVAAMTGLLLPSGGITVLMTAGYASIRTQPLVQAAMKGVLPATIGLSLAMGVQMAQPLVGRAQREGRGQLATHLALLVISALLLAVGGLSPAAILLIAGLAGALVLGYLSRRCGGRAEEDEEA